MVVDDSVETGTSVQSSAVTVRRFWVAWLVFLLFLVAALVTLILIASVNAGSTSIPALG